MWPGLLPLTGILSRYSWSVKWTVLVFTLNRLRRVCVRQSSNWHRYKASTQCVATSVPASISTLPSGLRLGSLMLPRLGLHDILICSICSSKFVMGMFPSCGWDPWDSSALNVRDSNFMSGGMTPRCPPLPTADTVTLDLWWPCLDLESFPGATRLCLRALPPVRRLLFVAVLSSSSSSSLLPSVYNSSPEIHCSSSSCKTQ